MDDKLPGLHEQVKTFLAGKKREEAAGMEVVPLMVAIAELKSAELRRFIAELGAPVPLASEPNIPRVGTWKRPRTDISILVDLRNWLINTRLRPGPEKQTGSGNGV